MNVFFSFAALAVAAGSLPIAADELPFIGGAPAASTGDAAVSPHVAMARELCDILSQTEQILQSYTDETGALAVERALREQRNRMYAAVAKQRALPDPGEDDIKAVNELADIFLSLAEGIRRQVRRLQQEGLMRPSLIALLQLPPDSSEAETSPATPARDAEEGQPADPDRQ